MFIRTPAQAPFANSDARFAVMLRSRRGTRVVEIGNRTVIALILLSALLFAWYLVATLYLVFRDDVVVSMISGQRRTHYAYEDRIVELRARIDKITARQLVNQESIEDRVASLVARQAELEARQVLVADLGQRAERGGLPASAPRPSIVSDPTAMPGSKALPFASPVASRPRPMPMEPLALPGRDGAAPAPRNPMEGVVGEVERRTETIEKAQIETLETIGQAGETEIERSRKTIAQVGLNPSRFGKNAPAAAPLRRPAPLDELMLRDVSPEISAVGGPLLPPVQGSRANPDFEMAIGRAENALEGARNARRIMESLPLGRPLGERFDLSSTFGTRLDPFTRGLALHSGLDFRAPTGTPVRAVAAGKIIEAGPNGGYGRMVEIDHGFGITTRYAHLSSISVEEGAQIAKGAVIGHVGSTGRSTGPHLHYEVRIDDDATDPMRFVRAKAMLD